MDRRGAREHALLERGLVESPEESMWVTTGERFSGQERSNRTCFTGEGFSRES